MKRYITSLLLAFVASTTTWAMDYETARERAYYLTDKMAYELNLNDQQYNDAYEINLDYLLSLNTADDLAETSYYLAYRNQDLRNILYDWQWTAFAAVDYLFRPVWWLNGGWYFPVFGHYARGYYFYHRPTIFWDYRGGHGRHYFAGGFYHNRRPMWQGGLRGMHRDMIGHPNGRGGSRYGRPGGGYRSDSRGYHFGNSRNDNFHGSTRSGNFRGNTNEGMRNGNFTGNSRGTSTPNYRTGNTRGTSTPNYRTGNTRGENTTGTTSTTYGNRGDRNTGRSTLSTGTLNYGGSRSGFRSSSRTTVGNTSTTSRSGGFSGTSRGASFGSGTSRSTRTSSFGSGSSRGKSSFSGSRGGSSSRGGGFSGGSRGGGRR